MSVDQKAIVEAVSGLTLEGNEDGLIPAFGLYLTRHFAAYYNTISFEFYRQAETAGVDQEHQARLGLIEAGHQCAFNTFGGIMMSQEWEAVVRPMLESREDWAYGIVGVINALGWGVWHINALEPGRTLQVAIDNSYESTGYLQTYGPRETGGICFLAAGGVAGIMNLLYHGDITQRPALTEEYYGQLFHSGDHFRAREVACRAAGAPRCELVAERNA